MINKILILCIIFNYLQSEIIRDDDNQVVFDTASKLMWQDDNDVILTSTKKSHKDAIDYCEALTNVNYTDWRLPNINELYTVIDFTQNSPAMNSKFIQTSSNKYWSSTTSKYNLSHAWYIDFSTGSSSYQAKSTITLLRCVRDIN